MMIQNPEVRIELDFSFSSQRAIPTDYSKASEPNFENSADMKHSCSYQQNHFENQKQCLGSQIITWLQNRGIQTGFPQDLLAEHREEQKREIVLKIGRKSSKDLPVNSTLLARRTKTLKDVTVY